MPTEWKYHADGVNTAVQTSHDLDGTLTNVRVELDSFRVREWTEDEVEEKHLRGNSYHYAEEKGVYEEHGGGAHATLRFNVDDGTAELSGIQPEDGGTVEPRHIPLLAAAKRIVEGLSGVEKCISPAGTLWGAYDDAEGIHIERLDN